MIRSPKLQSFLDEFVESVEPPQGIPWSSILTGSDHPYDCRCNVCLQWWVSMPPEEEGELLPEDFHGPFQWSEIWKYQDDHGIPQTKGYISDFEEKQDSY